ncbi:MAG: hypothetical protein EHM47_11860 [Ignavibacteriales bacterium]|nr:MAG: hypothetical protein EHM47_11860 [Ignavibacteriales bacterium]
MQKQNWKYYLFEILVVFLGIMAAFGLNSWWESVQEGNLEEKYLEGLNNDLDKNLNELSGLIEIAENNNTAIQKIVTMIAQNNFQTDTIIKNSVRMAYLFEFNQNSVTFETLKTSGNIQIISEYDVRNKIVEVYNHYSRIKKFDEMYRKYIDDYVIPFLWKNIDMITGEAVNSNFVKQVEFKNVLTGYLLMLGQQIDGYKLGYEKSKELKEMFNSL